ncbi:MAG TPA: DUF2232 domain-containing protein [Symbiobacteriaceae bacterium]
MAALAVVFSVIPGLGLFMPIPLVLAYVRYGGRVALLTGAVATLLSVMFRGPILTFTFLLPAGVMPGLVFGYGFRNKLKPLMVGILAVAIFFVGYFTEYVVTRQAVLGGRDPIAAMLEQPQVKQLYDQFQVFMKQVIDTTPQMTEEQRQTSLAQLEETQKNPAAIFWTLAPGLIFSIGAAATWLNYWICKWILPRFGHDIPAPMAFGEFRLPIWAIWVLTPVMFVSNLAGGSLLNAPWWIKTAQNIFAPLLYVLLLVGMAVVFGWLRKRDIAKPMAVAIMLFGLFGFGLAVGLNLYIWVALLDSVFDFRGLGHGIWKGPEPTE